MKIWKHHALSVLRRCKLIGLDAEYDFVFENSTVLIKTNESEWKIEAGTFLQQNDGFNCGPIACLKVIQLYRPTFFRNEMHTTENYWHIVMDLFVELLKKYSDDLGYSTRDCGADDGASVVDCDVSHSLRNKHRDCICGDTEIKLNVTNIPCCKRKMHAICLYQRLLNNATCVYCGNEVDETFF